MMLQSDRLFCSSLNLVMMSLCNTEGTICDDAFRPLHRPHLFNFESRLWELHCYPTITGQSITEAQFRYGLILLTNEQSGYVAFPVIPSTTVRHIDLRHRRPRIPHSNPYLHHYAAISASQLTCSIDMKFVKLPIFTGQAVVFRSFEADSRDCGSTNPNGYDAVAVIPYPVRQNLRENLRSMFREMRTGSLTPFADSLRFFTASLRFHGVRAVVIEAAFLVDEVATSQLNRGREASNLTVGFQKLVYPLLASFFMQGIVVCVATFDPNMTAVATRPRLAKIGDLSLYVSPGNPKPSALYYALLDALSGPFSDHVVNQKKGQWVASLSGKTTVYQPQSLVSLIVDGVAEVTGEKKRSFPLFQLTTFWREIISICRNIPPEEVKRSLQESEIVVLTKTASDVIYCSDCVVLQGTGKSIHLEDLTTIK